LSEVLFDEIRDLLERETIVVQSGKRDHRTCDTRVRDIRTAGNIIRLSP
jgi:hypothetical protein